MYGELRDELRVTVSLWQGETQVMAPRLSAVKLSMSVVERADHVTLRLNVETLKLWSAEIPNLYRAVVELHTADGTLIEAEA